MHHHQEGGAGHDLCYFTIRTDHSALKVASELQRPGSQMARDIYSTIMQSMGYNCSQCDFLTFCGFCFNETCPCSDFFFAPMGTGKLDSLAIQTRLLARILGLTTMS